MPRSRIGKSALLAIVLLLGLGLLAQDDASWFNQSWAPAFYAAKGFVGVVAVLVMTIHITRSWAYMGTVAQRLRYLLLGFVVVVGAASSAQYDEHAPVTGRNIAGFALALLTIPVAIISIRQDRTRS